MTKSFDERNAAKSGAVCSAMAEAASTGKLVLSERERQILDMWPRYEDGEYVWFGDEAKADPIFGNSTGVVDIIEFMSFTYILKNISNNAIVQDGFDVRVKRPVQSVLDADGVEVKVGDTVWANASERGDGREWTVTGLDFSTGYSVKAHDRRGRVRDLDPKWLTHTRPDSWERLEGDVNAIVTGDGMYHMLNNYCNARDLGGDDVMRLTIGDIVRRAKALAGVK